MPFQILDVIFTDRFQSILQRGGNKNILSLLSCGALSSHVDSRNIVKDFADRCVPNIIIIIKSNPHLPLAVDSSKRSYAFRNQISSPLPPTVSFRTSPFLTLYLTAQSSKICFENTKIWVLIRISSSFNPATLRPSDGRTWVRGHWEFKSITSARIVSD
jgi:hypothetical protein